jgi:hypothetical protein
MHNKNNVIQFRAKCVETLVHTKTDQQFETKLNRIKNSLNKISNLMADLKKMENKTKVSKKTADKMKYSKKGLRAV